MQMHGQRNSAGLFFRYQKCKSDISKVATVVLAVVLLSILTTSRLLTVVNIVKESRSFS